MNTNHTPGPWKILKESDRAGFKGIGIATETGTVLANLIFQLDDSEKANAKLIAAAPELLEALEAIRARMNGVFDHPALVKFGPLGDKHMDVVQIAQEALAKAEGK